ncbi:MAG: DUF169 domain-containing protein [bacterium]|nr:MAG: DUF169 domain-containing protein [bacterium]
MSEAAARLVEAIDRNVKPATLPVAVRMMGPGEEVGQKVRRPAADLGHRVAVCQGLNMARIFGWGLVFGRENQACPLASVAAGFIEADDFLEGAVAELYQDSPEVARKMEAQYPRHPVGQFDRVLIAPLSRAEFEPHVAVVYGNPAQILVLVHAANYGHGPGVGSSSTGRFGCAAWIAGVMQADECTYMIPCSGERVFAGSQDHEMSFLIPRSRFEPITEALAIMRKKGTYRYPVPNLSLLGEPRLPEKYLALDPRP